MPKQYRVNEVFYSLQGEGVRAGTANLFVRFSGCNLRCRADGDEGFDCDTEFTSGTNWTANELVAAARDACANAVIFTGGEPGLQLDDELVSAFKAAGLYTAVETNGTVEGALVLVDWICVSPKTAEHTLRLIAADEVKYVRRRGQGIPKPRIKATHYLLSPAFQPDGSVLDEDLNWCIALVKGHPKWRLSVQMHKLWSVR